MQELIKLKDGAILDISHENFKFGACDTCDYGAVYETDYRIDLTGISITLDISSKDKYLFPIGTMIRILCNGVDKITTLTEEEFYDWLKDEVYNVVHPEKVSITKYNK